MRIRIKFRKYGVMKFIGHLDIMRYFQKAIRRAEIPIAYSEGFSPHQIMSFAAPLGVGITSDGEYLDIELKESVTTKAALQSLNQAMVEGMEVTSFRQLSDSNKKAMSIVAAADYKISLKDKYEPADVDYIKGYEEFFVNQKEILVTKQTKKSEKVIDLKELVYDFKVEMEGNRPVFFLRVSTGSVDNLKPELVIEELYSYLGIAFDPMSIQIHRLDVFAKEDDYFVSLGEMGEIIE